jgi:hypothetical protein
MSPLIIENLNSEAGNKGGMKGAVARAEEKKITLNTPACSRLGWYVWPFALDSYGCFGEKVANDSPDGPTAISILPQSPSLQLILSHQLQ